MFTLYPQKATTVLRNITNEENVATINCTLHSDSGFRMEAEQLFGRHFFAFHSCSPITSYIKPSK